MPAPRLRFLDNAGLSLSDLAWMAGLFIAVAGLIWVFASGVRLIDLPPVPQAAPSHGGR